MHEAGAAGGHHDDIRSQHLRGQVARLPVADRDRGVLSEEEELCGLPDHVAATDDDRVSARKHVPGPHQDLDRRLCA